MHDLGVLMTFAVGLAAALVLGVLAHKVKLSPIVGYLLAGVVVGPFTPGFVVNRAVAEQFAEIGVILLLFGIGLRFHLHELVAVWRIAIPGALIQSTASTVLLAGLMRLVGWSWASGLILGMAISVASTVVMAMVLAEKHDLHTPIGHIAIGWTVVEDLLTVALLLLLPILFGSQQHRDAGAALAVAGLKVVGLLAVVVVLGRWVIPWALEHIERTRSRELFTLAVLVLAVGIAVGSARIFGVSMALGAFLAGLAVGRSEFAARAAADALPMRDAFAVLFFVSIGMLFDPRSLLASPLVMGLVLLVVLVGKPLAAILTVRVLGRPFATAIPVGAAFAQIGEFSFILGAVARQLGLLDNAGWNALVAASILSIALNPSLYRWARKLSAVATRRQLQVPTVPPAVDANRSIVVGYGPVGQIVHRLLTDLGKPVTIVDMRLDTVRRLKAKGVDAVYGDVLRSGTLEEAGVDRAGTLILAADLENAAEIVRQTREANPALKVLARCGQVRDAAALWRAGANVVAAGEAEVGVSLVDAMITAEDIGRGATPEQRAHVRRRLYGMDEAQPSAPKV